MNRCIPPSPLADPLAFDDAVATDEDTAVTFAPLGNDLSGSSSTPAIEIVQLTTPVPFFVKHETKRLVGRISG